MTAPIALCDVAAAAGALLVLSTVVSVVGTVIVPRKSGSRLTRLVGPGLAAEQDLRADRLARGQLPVARPDPGRARRQSSCSASWRSGWSPSMSVTRCWSGLRPAASALRSLPLARRCGPSSSPDTHGFFETALLDTAAMAGLITVTLQIAYLPALYAAFNRRENEIALLNSRAGSPSWGPELLARTHYALGSGISTLDTLPDFYNEWERWAADITESHVTYLPLVWFRSPSYEASWVTSLLAVLDSAALYLSLCPQAAPSLFRPGCACAADRRASPKWPAPWASRCLSRPPPTPS